MGKWLKWLLVVLFFVCVFMMCVYPFRGFIFGTSAAVVNAKSNADFGIADFHSSVDKDADGVDDQADVLEGARAYIATKPVYKSVYYEGGYPTDEYGVCTDVIAQAMLHTGYDLRALVEADIHARPEAYNVTQPDSNIDFRRVPNLQVYFAANAVALTTDLSQIDQWQGGDIVIFTNHIGIVSDVRNRKGVPYLIHHANPFQAYYEEDVMARYEKKIVGHYRLSE